MSNKQSSVEWLIEELRGSDDKGDFVFNGVITSELIEQAKVIEKQNIKAAYNQGYRDGEHDNGNTTHILGDVSVWDDSENYYNETYGGNK